MSTATTPAAPTTEQLNQVLAHLATVEFDYVPVTFAQQLMQNNLVECDPNNKNESGIATRITASGSEHVARTMGTVQGQTGGVQTITAADVGTISLTDGGSIQAASAATVPTAQAVEPAPIQIQMDTGIEPVAIARGRQGSGKNQIELVDAKYPFEAMTSTEHSFHIPCRTEKEQSELARALGNAVTVKNNQYRKQTGIEKYQSKVKGSDKQYVKNPDGSIQTVEKERPTYTYTKKWSLRKVGPADPRGHGVRVHRVV